MTNWTYCPKIDLEVTFMEDYKSMYLSLFNAVTDAINILIDAQREVENIYIESCDEIKASLLNLPHKDAEKEK